MTTIEKPKFTRLGGGLIRYDGKVWEPVRIREGASITCLISGAKIEGGAEAYRQQKRTGGREARDGRIAAEHFR